MSEAPLRFPDLPADHPANAVEAPVEAPQSQTAPVTAEVPPASMGTPADIQHPGDVPEASAGATTEGTTAETSETPTDSAGQSGEQSDAAREFAQALATPPAPSGVAFDGSVYRARSDNDVLTNTFCKVIAGPYTGRYGVYITTASLGADGWPAEVVVRTRDAEDENIVVAYADIRPDVAGRR